MQSKHGRKVGKIASEISRCGRGKHTRDPIAPKVSKQIDPAGNTSVVSIGFQSSKKSGSKISKGTSSSPRAPARAVAREVDLAKLRIEQLKGSKVGS